MKTKKAHFNNIDWSKTNSEIAEQIGVSLSTVQRYRRKMAKDTIKMAEDTIKKAQKNRADIKNVDFFNNVDWNKTDSAIAQQIGVSRNTVSKYRKKFAQGTLKKRVCLKEVNFDNIDWNKTNDEIAEQIGASLATVQRCRKNMAKDTMRKVRKKRAYLKNVDFNNIDWSKTNSEIAEQTGASFTTVRKYRKKYAQ